MQMRSPAREFDRGEADLSGCAYRLIEKQREEALAE